MEQKINYKNFPILYIDPQLAARQAFEERFGQFYSIYTASDVSGVMKQLEVHNIAVAVLTQSREAGLGLELIDRLRPHLPNIIWILATPESEIAEARKAAVAGRIVYYLLTGYNFEDLQILIREGIRSFVLEEEREELYQEKIFAMKKIARANRLASVGVLSASMAHEINNPLVAVSTFLQLIPEKIEESGDTQFWQDYYKIVLNELERIQHLTGRLVKYSRKQETDAVQLEWNDINNIVDDMVALISPNARQKHVEIEKKLERGIPPVNSDREKLNQVFLNLLLNALQSIDVEKPLKRITVLTRVTYSADREPAFVEVSVQDNGTGISKENLEKLFTPFFTTKNRDGSGLGLMTCHQIIDDHRGTINVKSKPEEGSTFIVQLPVNPESYDRRKANRRHKEIE